MSFAEELRAFSPVVVFIDDGFTPVSLDLIDADDWASLRSSDLSGWEALQKKHSFLHETPMALKRDAGELANVWNLYKEDPQEFSILDPIFKKISVSREIAIRPLREIIKFFEDEVEVEVCRHPDILSAEKDVRRSKLVFLDFYLYQQSTKEKAIEDAGIFSSLLSSKVEVSGDQHNRFLFLISTNLPSGTDIESFRKAANVKAAFFKPVSKESLSQNWIEKSLVKRVERYDDLHNLAVYLDTFSEQMRVVMENLQVDLEALELHDLAILDHMRLKVEKEDLGNYMSWLISEALAARIRASAPMLKASKNVSTVQRPPFHGMLSPNQVLFSWFSEITFSIPGSTGRKVQFGDVFSAEATTRSERDSGTSIQIEEAASTVDEGDGFSACIGRSVRSALGAIGVGDECGGIDVSTNISKMPPEIEPGVPGEDQSCRNLILVIAPACDLQRADCNYEVICVRGEVVEQTPSLVDLIEQRTILGKDKSGLYKHLLQLTENEETKYLLVKWYPDKITTIMASNLQGSRYSHLSRLNELFCQEIKEEALRQVGRVGVPVDPAFSVALGATIVYRPGRGDPVHIEIPDLDTVSGVITSGNENNSSKIILSDEFLERFSEEVEKIDSSLDVFPKLVDARAELDEKGGEGFALSKGKCQCKIAKDSFTIQYVPQFIRGSGEKGFCGVYFYPRGLIIDPTPPENDLVTEDKI